MKNVSATKIFVLASIIFSIILTTCPKAQSQVTLAIEAGAGAAGSSGNEVIISLDNPDDAVMALQLDICDTDDYLVVTGVRNTSRTEGFSCDYSELENGCARMLAFSMSLSLIAKGSGPVLIVAFDVKEDAPLSETRSLKLENVTLVDEDNYTLETTAVDGEFSFTSCKVTVSPKETSADSGESINFSASSAGDCGQSPVYSFEMETTGIGSVITANGLYTAGTNTTGYQATDIIRVTDTANSVSDTAEITVNSGSIANEGIINAISPRAILGSRWIPTRHAISITGKDTFFTPSSRVSFSLGDDNIWFVGKIRLGADVIIAIVMLNRNPLTGPVDVTVTTGVGTDIRTVTGYDMLKIGLRPFIGDEKKMEDLELF